MKFKLNALLAIALLLFLFLASCSNTSNSNNATDDTLTSSKTVLADTQVVDSSALLANPALVPPPSIQLEILASQTSVTDGEWTGHAFTIISIPLSSGIKEDGYGFYPKEGGFGQIYGPGVVRNETNYNPGRLSHIAVSVKKPITEEQRRSILRVADEWNDRDFKITNQNCIDFIKSVASTAGWTTVERTTGELPVTYVRRLKEANE